MSHPGLAVAYGWELRKLAAQRRTYLGLAGMAGLPLVFTAVMLANGGDVEGAVFGQVTETGLAAPLVLLFFASHFLFPLITALVAGDIVAAEDQHGTLKTILTRSVGRGAVFGGKVLATGTYAAVGLIVFAAVAVAAGGVAWGLQPLTNLSGTVLEVPRAILLIAGAVAAYGIPLLAVASVALLLSTAARNSAAAVVGTLLLVVSMTIAATIPGTDVVQPYLVTEQFEAWEGLLRDPIDWAPIGHALWVSALYSTPCLLAAATLFRRRDVMGG